MLKSSKLVDMAEAKCIARLVYLVDHDHTELVNMDDFSLNISDQLYCQLLVNLADTGSLLDHILIISNMKHKANINPIVLSEGRALTLNIAINKRCHILALLWPVQSASIKCRV